MPDSWPGSGLELQLAKHIAPLLREEPKHPDGFVLERDAARVLFEAQLKGKKGIMNDQDEARVRARKQSIAATSKTFKDLPEVKNGDYEVADVVVIEDHLGGERPAAIAIKMKLPGSEKWHILVILSTTHDGKLIEANRDETWARGHVPWKAAAAKASCVLVMVHKDFKDTLDKYLFMPFIPVVVDESKIRRKVGRLADSDLERLTEIDYTALDVIKTLCHEGIDVQNFNETVLSMRNGGAQDYKTLYVEREHPNPRLRNSSSNIENNPALAAQLTLERARAGQKAFSELTTEHQHYLLHHEGLTKTQAGLLALEAAKGGAVLPTPDAHTTDGATQDTSGTVTVNVIKGGHANGVRPLSTSKEDVKATDSGINGSVKILPSGIPAAQSTPAPRIDARVPSIARSNNTAQTLNPVVKGTGAGPSTMTRLGNKLGAAGFQSSRKTNANPDRPKQRNNDGRNANSSSKASSAFEALAPVKTSTTHVTKGPAGKTTRRNRTAQKSHLLHV